MEEEKKDEAQEKKPEQDYEEKEYAEGEKESEEIEQFEEKAEEDSVEEAEKEIEQKEEAEEKASSEIEEASEEQDVESKAEEELKEIKKEKRARKKKTPEELEEKQYRGKRASAKKEEGLKKTGDNIFALRTTANREDQVTDFLISNIQKKKLDVYSVIRPHGMRGYIFVEAESRTDAEQAAFNIPYARGILGGPIAYTEIEHMLEQVKVQMNIEKNDIVEIISGPFKRENAKVTRIDRTKEEVVLELLEAAVPIPITLKMDAIKVIRRESGGAEETTEDEEDEM